MRGNNAYHLARDVADFACPCVISQIAFLQGKHRTNLWEFTLELESTVKNFDTRVYSISDFLEWHNNKLLDLDPDFQRRAVWSEKAKSYLIDTIIRGRPIPKILISQKLEGARTVRVVVDGQQRLRAILGYLNGDFVISRAHNEKLAGKKYSVLPVSLQNDFLKYELGVDLLLGMGYEDILDIFARLNSYTVSLNKQELLNAKYLGYFKQAAYRIGLKYALLFLRSQVLTKAQVARMGEAELAGDMLMALVGGVQTNKSLEQYYKKYEDDPGDLSRAEERFDHIMSLIGAIYSPEELAGTNWSRIHLFYTLFTSMGHCLYGLAGLKDVIRVKVSQTSAGMARVCLDEISAKYDEVAGNLDDPNAPKDYRQFISQSRRATTDTQSRVDRARFVCVKLSRALG